MANKFEKYNEKLLEKVNIFEMSYGALPKSIVKHFFEGQHSMILEDSLFFEPDLDGLENYEKWLNE